MHLLFFFQIYKRGLYCAVSVALSEHFDCQWKSMMGMKDLALFLVAAMHLLFIFSRNLQKRQLLCWEHDIITHFSLLSVFVYYNLTNILPPPPPICHLGTQWGSGLSSCYHHQSYHNDSLIQFDRNNFLSFISLQLLFTP